MYSSRRLAARARILHELESGDNWETFFRVYLSLREELAPEDEREVQRLAARALRSTGAIVWVPASWGSAVAA